MFRDRPRLQIVHLSLPTLTRVRVGHGRVLDGGNHGNALSPACIPSFMQSSSQSWQLLVIHGGLGRGASAWILPVCVGSTHNALLSSGHSGLPHPTTHRARSIPLSATLKPYARRIALWPSIEKWNGSMAMSLPLSSMDRPLLALARRLVYFGAPVPSTRPSASLPDATACARVARIATACSQQYHPRLDSF